MRSLSFLLPQAAWTWPSHFTPCFLLQGEITHDEFCAACKRGASLQPCGTCSGAYHLSCLDPPLKTAPKGVWVCPKCQRKVWAEGLTPLPCTLETVFWVEQGVTGVLGTHPCLLQGRDPEGNVSLGSASELTRLIMATVPWSQLGICGFPVGILWESESMPSWEYIAGIVSESARICAFSYHPIYPTGLKER